MRQRYRIWTWIGVFMLVVVVVAGCTAPPTSGGAAPAADSQAPAADGGNGDVVEGWDGGYEAVPADLCPPGEDDAEVDIRVQQPIFFRQELGEEAWGDKGLLLTQRGLYANEQGEIFGIKVAGANSPSSEEARIASEAAIRAYSDALRICFDQIFNGEINGTLLEPKVEVPVADADAQASSDEETPDLEQVAAESLVIAIWSIGRVMEGDDLGEELGEILKNIVNEDDREWEAALSDLVSKNLQRQFISTNEEAKENPDLVVDFIIDPSINNGVRHQYVEYVQKAVLTTVSVGGSSGAGSVKASLCRDSSSSPFMNKTVDHSGTQSAPLSGTSTSSKTYDLGVIGKKNASKYRMTGRWYRDYNDPAPSGSVANCNPPINP